MRQRILNMILFFGLLVGYHNHAKASESDFKYKLAICAIFRDDAAYLKEWIEFHRLVGVDHFFLYNHMSEDNFIEVLQPYINAGVVDLIDWSDHMIMPPKVHDSWISIQIAAYTDAIQKYQKEAKWIAYVDTDEFLFAIHQDNLVDFLKDYEEFGGLCVNWVEFGTSHVSHIPHGQLMIELLVYRGEIGWRSRFHKSIVNPRRVDKFCNVHAASYQSPFFHVSANRQPCETCSMVSMPNINVIRINHYWTRDEAYFFGYKLRSRMRRGWIPQNDLQRASEASKELDLEIARFIPALRARMEQQQ